MNQEKIGKFIQEKRKEKELSQMDLAEKLGVSNRTISKWENGHGMPDYSMINDLCDALDVTINELLSGEELNNDNYQKKLEENIVNTIDYNNKKRNKKFIKYICIILFVLILYFIYKAFIISYYDSRIVTDHYDRVFPYNKNIFNLNVKNNKRANTLFNDYEKLNFYLPDGFELVTDKSKSNFVQNECDLYLKNYTNKDEFDASIIICNRNDTIHNLERIEIRDSFFPLFITNNILEKNNINSSMDIIRYYENHYDDKFNIFSDSNKIKMNFIGKNYSLLSMGDYDNFYYLNGDSNGYLTEVLPNYKNMGNYAWGMGTWNSVYYYNNDVSFSITFHNKNVEYFNHDNVLEIIESVYK